MSYMTEVYMNRQIAQAADALELMEACKSHRLTEADSGKFTLIADEMKRATQRFYDLAGKQSVLSADDFFRKALDRAKVMKAERAVLMTIRRKKREADQAARQAMLDEMALISAAA